MLATGQPLSALRRVLRKYPQSVLALKVREKLPLEQLSAVQDAIRTVESELAERGRILVRYSGTEPKIRLLVEHEDSTQVTSCLARLEAAVRRDLVVG
jgi:phosphoglucosamine mutase